MKGLRLLAVAVILGGLVSLVIGIVFIVQSVSVKAEITEGLAAEEQTSQLPEEGEEGYFEGNVVDTAGEAAACRGVSTRAFARRGWEDDLCNYRERLR